MDPITIAISCSLASLCIGGGIGFLANHYFKVSPEEMEFRRLNRELIDFNFAKNNLEAKNNALEAANKRLQEQRNDYAKIASTHDIKMSDISKSQGKTQEIERKYDSSLDKNLDRLFKDLKDISQGGRVSVTLEAWVTGTWKKHLMDLGWRWKNTQENTVNFRAKHAMTWELDGDSEEVFDEVETILKDPQWDLWSPVSNGWYHSEAPISLEVKIIKSKMAAPQIQTVEVLRIEKEIEIIEVVKEVPVFIGDSQTEEVTKDIKELIAAQVEVELSLRQEKEREYIKRNIVYEG